MNERDLLATVPIFSDLSKSEMDHLCDIVIHRSYKKGNMILMEDEFGDTFFIIKEGSVKITRLSEDGREVILAMLGEGEFFGEMSLLDGQTRSANAIALEDSEALILKRVEFIALLKKYPKVSISLLRELTQRLRKSDQQIESLSLSNAEHKIGITLLRLADEMGTIRHGKVTIKNLPYQQDIANMAGTSRETVSRTLKILEERNLIERTEHSLIILDYLQFKRLFGK
ncbi:MAG: Crp/Fnr family transcriptional regulator [Candidatus Marinimicrobia bacterium]|nr:Crp/Fnr family transcriptional regulator [Candidatus Neomarinimicrobiota bacterium]MBL7046145.1 Crp/Fnr family transcriptional regulator [Candidatus Neomarinimicrobiota bacterium]